MKPMVCSRFLRGLGLLAVVAAFAAGSAGCAAEYDHTDISGFRPSLFQSGEAVDRSHITVHAGMIVTAHVVAYNNDHNIMTMSVRAHDPTIVDVSNVISDHDFAFIGMKPGVTDVEIVAGNKVVLIISAVVLGQPALP